MFGSISKIRVDRVERYASEWARCRNWLKERLGDVVILPVIPLTASRVEDKTVVRGLLDLAAWYESLQDQDKTVPEYQEGMGGYLPRKEK
jgi:hypothetical protein